MTLTIGRLTLDDPTSVGVQGGDPSTLAIAGEIGTSASLAAADALAMKRQLLGLRDDLVPVVWDADADLSGFYRVADVSAQIQSYIGGSVILQWAMQLPSVGGTPDFESLLVGAQVPNVHGVVGTPWWTAPARMTHMYPPGSGGVPGSISRTTATGGAIEGATFTTAPLWARFMAITSSWYQGACRIEADGAVMHGTDGPPVPYGDRWILTNDLVRVTPVFGSSQFDVAVFSGGLWRTKTFVVQYAGDHGFPSHVTVLRNDPQAAALRVLVDGRRYIDIFLRRGAPFVTFTISDPAGAGTLGIKRGSGGEAATALPGGIRATANDVGGNRFVMSSPTAFTADVVAGGLTTPAAARKVTINVGYEIGGSGAAAKNTAADVVAQSMWHTEESVKPMRL